MKPPRSVWAYTNGGAWVTTGHARSAALMRAYGYTVVRYVLPAKPKPRKRKGAR